MNDDGRTFWTKRPRSLVVKAEIPSRLGNSPKYLAAAELGSAFVGAEDGGLETSRTEFGQ